MMKKHLLTAALVAVLSMTAACGTQNVSEDQAPVSTMEESLPEMETLSTQEISGEEAPAPEAPATEAAESSTAVDAAAVQGTEAEMEATSVTGIVDEIQNSMFVITDAAGTSYIFPIEAESELDLTAIEAGDKVTVNYVGIVSDAEPFEGEVLSIQKVEE